MTSNVKIYIIKDYDLETTTGLTGTSAHFAQKAQRKKVKVKLDGSKYVHFFNVLLKIAI